MGPKEEGSVIQGRLGIDTYVITQSLFDVLRVTKRKPCHPEALEG